MYKRQVVTGPIIISIGLILAPSAITNCQSNWLLAFVALGTVIAVSYTHLDVYKRQS